MHYIYGYEISAFIFLLIITARFFERRNFPNAANKLFGFILWVAITDLALDILSSVFITYLDRYPYWLVLIVNTAFYSLQNIFPVLVIFYILVLAGQIKQFTGAKAAVLLFPMIFFQVILLINPLTKLVFYSNEINIYTRGPLFNYFFLGSLFYMLVTVYYTVKFRSRLQPIQYKTILCFIFLIVAAVLIQYFFPSLLLIGVAIALSITMMFITIQNSDDMRDIVSDVFNFEALLLFLRSCLEDKRPCRLIAINIGGFNRVNSLLGTEAGHQLLRQVGSFLRGLPKGCWSFRLSGTRFAMIIFTGEAYAEVLKALDARFAQPWQVGGMKLNLYVNNCLLQNINYFSSAENIVSALEAAFGDLEKGDNGRSLILEGAYLAAIKRKLEIEEALRLALEGGGGNFELIFQPIYSTAERNYPVAEVLLRFNNESLGSVSPSEFIPLAERAGLIRQIDELVIKKSCQFIINNQALMNNWQGVLEVNLSASEFFSPGFADKLHELVSSYAVDPAGLCFEVTETAATVSCDILRDCMTRLQALGYCFALDDFGTGYSNLVQVISLPFNAVKLDRSLLTDKNSDFAMLFFNDLVKMFKRAKLKIIIEGVEDAAEAEYADALQIDFIQGFYYSYPLPEKDFIKFLHSRPSSDIDCG